MRRFHLVITFLDIEKAYDSVPWNKIWECLEELKVPKYLIDKVKMLYQNCYSCVQIEEDQNGLRQREVSNKEVLYHHSCSL